MNLDRNDPFLRHNLNRLEERFRTRYYSSLQKDIQRRKSGKRSHSTTLKSIVDNKKRFEEVQLLKHQLLGDVLCLSMKKKAKMLKSVKISKSGLALAGTK